MEPTRCPRTNSRTWGRASSKNLCWSCSCLASYPCVRRSCSLLIKGSWVWLSHNVLLRFGHHLKCCYTPTTKCGGGAILDSLCPVSRSVGRSVGPSPILVRSITPLLMEGFPSNLNDTFTSTRGCAEPMLPMCQVKVKVTVKGQIFNKQYYTLCRVRSITPLLTEGFPSNLNDTFTSTRGPWTIISIYYNNNKKYLIHNVDRLVQLYYVLLKLNKMSPWYDSIWLYV